MRRCARRSIFVKIVEIFAGVVQSEKEARCDGVGSIRGTSYVQNCLVYGRASHVRRIAVEPFAKNAAFFGTPKRFQTLRETFPIASRLPTGTRNRPDAPPRLLGAGVFAYHNRFVSLFRSSRRPPLAPR